MPRQVSPGWLASVCCTCGDTHHGELAWAPNPSPFFILIFALPPKKINLREFNERCSSKWCDLKISLNQQLDNDAPSSLLSISLKSVGPEIWDIGHSTIDNWQPSGQAAWAAKLFLDTRKPNNCLRFENRERRSVHSPQWQYLKVSEWNSQRWQSLHQAQMVTRMKIRTEERQSTYQEEILSQKLWFRISFAVWGWDQSVRKFHQLGSGTGMTNSLCSQK